MINAAITDGDVVVVRQQPQAENGEIVAAMIDGETTVKTLQRAKDQAWLMPHNPAYQPIPAKDATILGKVRYRNAPRLTDAQARTDLEPGSVYVRAT